jgi:CNT family concentrative nucleoside transporter
LEAELLLQAVLGLFVFISLASLPSEHRGLPDWKVIGAGLALQVLLAALMLWVPFVQDALKLLNEGVSAIAMATEAGTRFVFGFLGGQPDPQTNPYPFQITDQGSTFILAFRVLPLILFFTVLSALLWYFRVLPVLIRGFSFVLRKSLGVGGAVGVSTAANIFLGVVEAPILVKPYLARLTRSELFVVMTCGMATVAGSVMILYSVILESVIPNALGHVLTASVISAPAAIMIAKLMIPGDSATEGQDTAEPVRYLGVMDAITRGTQDGLRLMINVGAMLIVLVALVALVNAGLSLLPTIAGDKITLERMLGYIFAPIVWLMGIPWHEATTAGALMGTKTVLNELIAYLQLASLPEGALSEHSRLIMTYAICGFANFGSLGIMIGGIGAMCPQRKEEIVSLAPMALISGTLATCMTGALVGILT